MGKFYLARNGHILGRLSWEFRGTGFLGGAADFVEFVSGGTKLQVLVEHVFHRVLDPGWGAACAGSDDSVCVVLHFVSGWI